MFSKELDNLIDATLVDGKLDDLEKQALVERAEKEGVSQTELLVYINSILQKRAQTRNAEEDAREEERAAKILKEKGRLCPHCHAPIPPLAEKCPECGAIIMTAAVNEKIEKMMAEVSAKFAEGEGYTMKKNEDKQKGIGLLREAKQKNLELKMLYSSVQKVSVFCEQMDRDISDSITKRETTKSDQQKDDKASVIVAIVVGGGGLLLLLLGTLLRM